jgi:superfamily II DNA/RNA helicase
LLQRSSSSPTSSQGPSKDFLSVWHGGFRLAPKHERKSMSFATLGLHSSLLETLTALGYGAPTPVQSAAIPAVLAGADLLVSSQTGSGKTAAFMLPSLHRLWSTPPAKPAATRAHGPRILVLAPTRELALQVEKAARTYGDGQRLRSACLVGGMPYGLQLKQLSRPVDVVIATPGRLKDHLDRGRIDLGRVEILVLDEADRMLDMGFTEDIDAIVARTPGTRQTLLFSATLDGVVGRLAQRVTRAPQRIDIAATRSPEGKIEQRALFADDLSHKTRLLDALLRDTELKQAVVFTATKRGAEDLSGALQEQGFSAGALHGDMRQRERSLMLQRLRDGDMRVLVATDVAARHRRARHQPRHQLRRAAPGRGLHPSHRPHRPGGPSRRRRDAACASRKAPDAQHRAVHRCGVARRRHLGPRARRPSGAR